LIVLWRSTTAYCYLKEAPIHGMIPNEIREILLSQKQRVAEACQG
jgi:hypothetical protein